jgi:hypothetical protein
MLKVATIFSFCLSLFILSSCKNDASNISTHSRKLNFTRDTSIYKKLIGTWIHHDSVSFYVLEIKDTSNVDITYYIDLKKRIDTLTSDRFTYMKAKGKMVFWNDSTFNLDFSKFWLDFKLQKDIILEIGKQGDDAIFYKMNQRNNSIDKNKFGEFPIQ